MSDILPGGRFLHSPIDVVMRFSVIIPAYNEEKLLPRLLESIKVAASNYSGGPNRIKAQIQVIVADNDSTDGTAEVASAARYWYNPER